MIELTKINQKKFVLNCELIESVESTPDTVIVLRNGKLYIVKEPPEEIVEKTVAFKKMLFGGLMSSQPDNPAHPDNPAQKDSEAEAE